MIITTPLHYLSAHSTYEMLGKHYLLSLVMPGTVLLLSLTYNSPPALVQTLMS
jgi:hypothetical protein